MKRIIDLHLSFLDRMLADEGVVQELESERISIMTQFAEQVELARAYYDEFYSKSSNRLVLCGINPRQYGSGKTGLPFIDFNGINQLMSGNYGDVQERSAQFMLSVIEGYEIGEFQDAVYLTNLSWYGFKRDGKNMNYYNLPRTVRHRFIESFAEEMKIVQPTAIIPLSGEVERKLKKLAAGGQLDFPIADRLPHPFNCSFPTNIEKSRLRYHMCIEQHTGLQRKDSHFSSALQEPVAGKALATF